MKKFLILAAAAVVGVSCEISTIDKVDDNIDNGGAVLYVSELSTRVSFDDNDTDGLELNWEVDDLFTIYDGDGNRVDNFKCTSIDEEIKFQSADPSTQLEDNSDYVAIYPASDATNLEDAQSAIDPSVQNGDEINNLDNALYMLANFNYTSESTITFEHQMAVMTFKFKSATTPKSLVFENGDDIYTVNYSTIKPEGDIYTSHIMIKPCDAVSRSLIFSLYGEEDSEPYEVRKTTSTKAYEAGVRYTASVSTYAKEAFFSGGTGTESDPYLISTADDMRELANRVSGLNGYEGTNFFVDQFFKLTNDINLGGESNEFTSVGRFEGTFDGNNKTITGLYTNKPTYTYNALFISIYNAVIKNLTVYGSVTGKTYVGGIVGRSKDGSTVSNCHSYVVVNGGESGNVGGIVGYNSKSTVINCSNNAAVSGGNSSRIGGIVGYTYYLSTVTNCYNRAAVSGKKSTNIGGIVGLHAESKLSACYNSGNVSCDDDYMIGGIVGRSYNSSISLCYYNKDVYSNGNLVGSTEADGEVDGSCDGITTSNLQNADFTELLNYGAVLYNDKAEEDAIKACSWKAVSGNYSTLDPSAEATVTDVPVTAIGEGTEASPYKVFCDNQLTTLASDVTSKKNNYKGKYIKMVCDIDLKGEIFAGIGYYKSRNDKYSFQGNFDGDGHMVKGLNVNNPNYSAGLFNNIQDATIKNLGVSGSAIGKQYVGGIAGYASNSQITNCYNTAEISKSNSYLADFGGIVGSCKGSSITACYNTGKITGSISTGGIVGLATSSSKITACYNRASIIGTRQLGGIVGYLKESTLTNSYSTAKIDKPESGGVIGLIEMDSKAQYIYCTNTNSYHTGTISDNCIVYPADCKTESEMKEPNFANLLNNGFTDSYWIRDYFGTYNNGFPILKWQK